ncbi:MAG: DUF1697 domain-containing protein [Gemmatimonadota bacterium]|nr:DUF1697 domain-containing protein [Gemmatimonadota bacterium]
MPRYAAFLRGVSPLNATMPDLRAAFEAAGFTDVKTVLSSGNVMFTAPRTAESSNPKGAVFMTLIEKTFGKEVTTRTWDTVAKVAR